MWRIKQALYYVIGFGLIVAAVASGLGVW